MEDIKAGLVGESTQTVTEQATAASFSSGLVPAFATPAMIALMENASVNAIQKHLPAGQTSVGIEINVKHLAPTPVGMHVRARAQVLSVDGRRVSFQVEAWDDSEKIGEGTHQRMVVAEAKFNERIKQKAEAGK